MHELDFIKSMKVKSFLNIICNLKERRIVNLKSIFKRIFLKRKLK